MHWTDAHHFVIITDFVHAKQTETDQLVCVNVLRDGKEVNVNIILRMLNVVLWNAVEMVNAVIVRVSVIQDGMERIVQQVLLLHQLFHKKMQWMLFQS